MPAISVIIPVYNAERFLGRCLGSLQGQTFADWEAICVNDGSTDGTGALLDRLAAEDARIRVVHKDNAGVSDARNDALALAQGTYVLFVDSDDFLHPQTMEITLGLAERDGSDIVAFTYDHAYRNRMILRHLLHIPELRQPRFKVFTDFETAVTDHIFDSATEYSRHPQKLATRHCQPWRRLYRRSVLDGIRFIPGIIYEDFPWWSEVLLRVRKATLTDLPLYFYYPNRSSYIFSAREAFKIRSLRTAVQAAKEVYKEVDPIRKEQWEKEFLQPFEEKLARKERRFRNA